jgi:hypothetical protein
MPPQSQQSKPDPGFIPAGPDFIPAEPSYQAPDRPGFFESLGQSFGIDKEHPIRSGLQGLLGLAAPAATSGPFKEGQRIGGELIDAAKNLRSNPAQSGMDAIKAIPIFGPALDRMSDQAPVSLPGESYMGKVRDAATDPGVMGTGIGAATQAAPLILGGVDSALPGREPIGRIPTKAHAGQLLEDVRTAINKPRVETVARPKGFLMPPEQRIPLHEQPFTPGETSKPITLNEPGRPTRPLLPAPSADTPLSEKVDIFPNQLPHGATGIREPFGQPAEGLGHAESIGEIPGTGGGRQPLQGVMSRRPEMSPSEPPPPRLFFDNQVRLSRSLPLIEKAQRLSEEGHGAITPMDSLYKRINTINPLDYDEAFSRHSALGSLTAEDKMRATPTLKAAAKKANRAFGEDIGDVAERAGVGPKFRQGMKEYSRASRLSDALGAAKKYAVPAAIGLGAGAGATRLYHMLQNMGQ